MHRIHLAIATTSRGDEWSAGVRGEIKLARSLLGSGRVCDLITEVVSLGGMIIGIYCGLNREVHNYGMHGISHN